MEDQQEPGDLERVIDRLVERYIDERIAGLDPDLEALASTLPDAEARGRFRARALAEEYLILSAEGPEGQDVRLEAYLRRLQSEAERRLFHQVLGDEERARASLPGELVPGKRLDGRYEIRRKVGQGGMGTVYAAFDHKLEREVAVKVLRLGAGPGAANWAELFQRESKTLARLASHNIVTIHDAVSGAEHSYIVMDLVRGKDLLRILEEVNSHPGSAGLQPGSGSSSSSSSPPNQHDQRRAGLERGAPGRPEPLRQVIGRAQGGDRADLLKDKTHARCVARILRAIAVTLEHAHGAGVIHRDLKPQNVMLVPGGEPVLLDFGLASWGAEGSEQGFRGTPEYMAPEQIERMRAGNDPRTDVYQLGLMLYEMLALRRAYPRTSREELWTLFERIQKGERVALGALAPRVPRALRAIAEKAMDRDPARRHQTMRELRADLVRFLAGLPPEHAPLPPALRFGLRVGYVARQPLTAAGAAVALAAVLWFRTPPWVPPVLSVFKAESSEVSRLEDGQRIELADIGVLGLDVEADDSTWLYVFQLYGSSEEDKRAQFLHPVYPMSLEAYVQGEPPVAARGVRFEPGNHQLACAELERPRDYEGLVVYACPARDEVLEEWQSTLLALEAENGVAVPLAEAEQHLENLRESLRGDPLGTISLEARRHAVGNVLAAEKEGTIPRRYRFFHRVELRRAAPGSPR